MLFLLGGTVAPTLPSPSLPDELPLSSPSASMNFLHMAKNAKPHGRHDAGHGRERAARGPYTPAHFGAMGLHALTGAASPAPFQGNSAIPLSLGCAVVHSLPCLQSCLRRSLHHPRPKKVLADTRIPPCWLARPSRAGPRIPGPQACCCSAGGLPPRPTLPASTPPHTPGTLAQPCNPARNGVFPSPAIPPSPGVISGPVTTTRPDQASFSAAAASAARLARRPASLTLVRSRRSV